MENEKQYVTICAWCDTDNVITNRYKAEGYTVSHGICETHMWEEMEKQPLEKPSK